MHAWYPCVDPSSLGAAPCSRSFLCTSLYPLPQHTFIRAPASRASSYESGTRVMLMPAALPSYTSASRTPRSINPRRAIEARTISPPRSARSSSPVLRQSHVPRSLSWRKARRLQSPTPISIANPQRYEAATVSRVHPCPSPSPHPRECGEHERESTLLDVATPSIAATAAAAAAAAAVAAVAAVAGGPASVSSHHTSSVWDPVEPFAERAAESLLKRSSWPLKI